MSYTPAPLEPMPPPAKRKRRRAPWMIGAVLLFLVMSALARTLHESRTPTALPTSQATTVPTRALTPAATTAPTTALQPTSGPALLGAPLGAFVAIYGQPNEQSSPSLGEYHFQRYPGSLLDFLILLTDTADTGTSRNRVQDIAAQASDTGAHTGWTPEQASATCGAFFPRDAVYQRRVATHDGFDTIYSSASLASLFPATAFTDASSVPVQAGSFDVFYLYKASPLIASCDLLIGTQQTYM